jgi:chromosome partitioning protein
MSMKILAVTNQKSTGKSTLCFHLGHLGVEKSLRVLLVNLDGQGSLDLVFPANFQLGANGEPVEGQPEYLSENLAIFRADETLFDLDAAPDSFLKNLRVNLKQYDAQFDLCIIDTPGRICMPLKAAMVAADAVLCPVTMGLFEIAALADLWKFIQAIKQKGLNTQLRILGILPNKINTKSREELEGLAMLREQFGDAIMPETLAERASVKQALSRHRPVWLGTKGAGHRTAGLEWKSVCNTILVKLGSIAK